MCQPAVPRRAHSLDTTIPLEYPPERVAMGALFAAVRHCSAKLPLPQGNSFAQHFNIDHAVVTGGQRPPPACQCQRCGAALSPRCGRGVLCVARQPGGRR
jgi:hypothetical protein